MEGTVLSIKKTTDLAGKSGVYKIGFSGTDNFYIGSSNDIAKRFTYHRSRLKRGVHENPCLTNAFNKYGIDNCFIEIMKVCDASDILIHEQYFLDTLKPEYNISKSATSGITSKLSNEDILQIRFDYYNRSCREEIQELVDASHLNLPVAQVQKLTEEDIPKIRWAHQQGISHREISKVFGCHYNTSCDIKMNRVYKNITNTEPCEHLFKQVA